MTAAPPLALSIGDPAGVGPELAAAAWSARDAKELPPFFAVGNVRVFEEAARVRGVAVPVAAIDSPEQALDVFGRALPVLETGEAHYTPGAPSRQGAELALAALTEATRLVLAGQARALVTGPIAKSLLAEVGFTQPGQTEFVADACGIAREDAVMMLAGPTLRAVPLTVHCALADVPALLNRDLIERKARIVARALNTDFGIARPRLCVCGLNPHAGEQGRFGDEESRLIGPAIVALQAEGLDITGPHAADALFSPLERTRFDVALAMYHDQALIPVKALDFDQGVNVTLGLPIVRTSPDHGTAFGIAGTGQADAGATVAAIRMAHACAARRA